MRLLYSAGIALYGAAVKLAAFKKPKAALMIAGHKKVFDYLRDNRRQNDRYLWFHAASLGEFEQGRPLIEKIRQLHPEYKIAVTFFSSSGYEVRKNYQGADLICYLPFDTPSNVERFLNLLRPEKAFFIKYEFWANYICELKKRNIPIYLFSAIFRPEQVFFKPYGGFFRKLLHLYEQIFVQDDTSLNLLHHLGVTQVQIAGDTRFDRVCEVMKQSKSLPIVESFVGNAPFTLVAGSSWPKDEEIIISHFNQTPDMKLIIAPHEIHEEHIAEIISRLKRPYVRYSQLQPGEPIQADCLIVDCIGLLLHIYRYGQIAYIGGGFGVGIHNVLEAAVFEIPVIFGPNYHNFREACELISAQGGFSISTAAEYTALMKRFLSDTECLQMTGHTAGYYVRHNAGATDLILNTVF